MTSAPLTLLQRVTQTLEGLCAGVAAFGGRDRSKAELVLQVWTLLRLMLRRFERLTARIEAGGPAPTRRKPATTPATRRPAACPLPRGTGWLMREMPGINIHGLAVQGLLQDAALLALLAAEPAAARILGPLYAMFAVPRPARPRPPRPVKPPRPEPEPKPKPEKPDRPHILPGQTLRLRRMLW